MSTLETVQQQLYRPVEANEVQSLNLFDFALDFSGVIVYEKS